MEETGELWDGGSSSGFVFVCWLGDWVGGVEEMLAKCSRASGCGWSPDHSVRTVTTCMYTSHTHYVTRQ
jgi:hypothetical protein